MLRRPATPVVFGIDDNYSVDLAVALRSLVVHNRANLATMEVIVLYEHLGADSMRRLHGNGQALGSRFRLLRCDLPDRAYKLSPSVKRANYLRLFIDRVLEDYDRALYLDSDVLVLSDLAPLLAADLGELPLAAVQDPIHGRYRYGSVLPGWKELGIPPDREYFNSGVLLLQLETCRRDRLFERALRFVEERPDCIRWPDQDALNWAVDDRWLRLGRAWNTAPVSPYVGLPNIHHPAEDEMPLRMLADEEPAARIMHYMTDFRPWSVEFPDGPARRRYLRFLLEAQVIAKRFGERPRGT